jgi:formamidopyrimidine-DNA glycosylase
MPELPEVETIARDLRPLVVGAEIAGARVAWQPTLRNATPDEFDAAIAGRTIEAVGRRGKQLVVDLSGGVSLTIHLKMTGQLFVVPSSVPIDPYVRAFLTFADGRDLRFRDIRKFGRIGVYARDPATGELRDAAGADTFAAHGPEPLDPAFTARRFRERLLARRGRLKSLLVDQAFLAGVGNIYADEALWRARLHPLRTADTLHPADATRLYRQVRAVLTEAIERRGSSVDDYTAPEGDGEMQEHLDVYQRTGLPCPRCGHPLRRIVIGARGTHFCSWCQRLPASDRAGAAAILRGAAPRRASKLGSGAGRGSGTNPRAAKGRSRTGSRTPSRTGAADATRRTEATRRAAAARRAAARGGATQQAPERGVPDAAILRRGPRWTDLPAGEGIVGLRAREGRRGGRGGVAGTGAESGEAANVTGAATGANVPPPVPDPQGT